MFFLIQKFEKSNNFSSDSIVEAKLNEFFSISILKKCIYNTGPSKRNCFVRSRTYKKNPCEGPVDEEEHD